MKTIGVIGLGSIGMRHARNLVAMGHHVLGMDPDQQAMESLLNNLDGGVLHLQEQQTDGIIIASPTHFHAKQLEKFSIWERPLFIEKPIADELVVIPPCLVMVGYNLRFHSCVIQAREWLQEGIIGQPLWANLTCAQHNDKPAYLRDGVILNWSHEIDLALYLLGPAKVAAASAQTTDGNDDMADIILHHDNGCHSAVHLDYLTRPEIRQTMIVGSEASIIIDLVNRHAWLRDVDGQILEHFEGQDSWDENYKTEIQAFLDRIDGKETLGATGEEGLATLKVCLDARKMAGLA